MTTTAKLETNNGSDLGPRDVGLHGWTMVAWTVAGGVALGGVAVAYWTLAGRLSANGVFLTATGLFAIGAFLGLVHGAVLGWFGRKPEVTGHRATRDLLVATLYALPALAVGWLASIWIAMTVVAAYLDRLGPTVGAAAGWVLGGVILAWAAVSGARALENAYARWPESAVGTVVVGATFVALVLTFLAERPELWGLRLRFTEVGGVLLAAAISLWVVGPAVTVALRLMARLPDRMRPRIGLHEGWGAGADLALGLTVGLVVGLLAVPFAAPVATGATAGAMVVAVSQALVDEVLLRLVLVTAVAWLVLRWHEVHREEVAVVAVVAVALVQAALYTPGVLAIGFPTMVAATAFALTAVVLPALAFGALYWTRGFSTALVADAAFVAAVLILAT